MWLATPLERECRFFLILLLTAVGMHVFDRQNCVTATAVGARFHKKWRSRSRGVTNCVWLATPLERECRFFLISLATAVGEHVFCRQNGVGDKTGSFLSE